MGSHGLYGKNVWYEESIRIPLYFRGPGIKPGSTDVLFTSPDHMPTLLELLGAPVPETVEGSCRGSYITGAASGQKEPDHAFLCMFPGMPELVNPYRKLGMNPKSFGWRGIRTKAETYVIDRGTTPGAEAVRYLYHNDQDPYQMHPEILAPDSETAKKYDKLLMEYFEMLNDPFVMTDSCAE